MLDDIDAPLDDAPTVFRSRKFTGNQHRTAELAELDPPLAKQFEDATVVDCQFEDYTSEGARLYCATFENCSFKNVDFYWASAFCTRFIRCQFEDVDFRGANLTDAVFKECRLLRCDFSPDNLGATTDLTKVSFEDTEQIDCLR